MRFSFNKRSAVITPASHTHAQADFSERARDARDFYRRVLLSLAEGGVSYLVGGAYAYARFTGIRRRTKDFDLFVRPEDVERALAVLDAEGFRTEMTFPHWLGKVGEGEHLVDVIFSSGNGVARVDDAWFEHAVPGEILAVPVMLTPAEEMLWSKSFIMERERYDGADVLHLLNARGRHMDWERLVSRFGDEHWRLLFSYLVLYGFAYPDDELPCPRGVMDSFMARLHEELDASAAAGHATHRTCRGTLMSREQYLIDTQERGYFDGRQVPRGTMSTEEIEAWTDAIRRDHSPE